MTDNPKNSTVNHLFSLIRLKPDCKILPTLADFAPPFAHSSHTRSCLPTFNSDHSPSTPSFILLTDTKTQERGLEADRIHFEERLREVVSAEEHSFSESASGTLETAIPSSNYCQICREHFRNYEEHVELKNHILRWQHNEFNQDIHRLCESFCATHSPSTSSPKTKPIAKPLRMQKVISAKFSPKTRIEHQSKRRMSLSLDDVMLGGDLQEVSFNLAAE